MKSMDALIAATNTRQVEQATVRIAEKIRTGKFMKFPFYLDDVDLGVWNSYKHKDHKFDMSGAAKLNGEIQSITDRVAYEAAQLNDGILDQIGTDQFAAAVSWAAVRFHDNTAKDSIERASNAVLSNQSYGTFGATGWYAQDATQSWPVAYTMAAKTLVSFLNDDLEHATDDEGQALFGLMKMGENEDADDSDGETPEDTLLIEGDEDEKDTASEYEEDAFENMDNQEKVDTHSRVISYDNFEKYLSSNAAIFDKLSELIEDIPALTIYVNKDLRPDPDGPIVDQTVLDLNQITKMTASGFADMASSNTYFALRAANNELRQHKRFTTDEVKRIELVMIDASGSMDTADRSLKALGYLWNRLNRVISGDAVIAVVFFGTRVVAQGLNYNSTQDEFYTDLENWVIDTPEKAERGKEIFYSAYCSSPTGGATNIPAAIREGYTYAKMLRDESEVEADGLPHLTMVTDDDMGSGSIVRDRELIVNGLVVKDNAGLQKVVKESGGTYMMLDSIRKGKLYK